MTRLGFSLSALSLALTISAAGAWDPVGPPLRGSAASFEDQLSARNIGRLPSTELHVAQALPLATPPAAPPKAPSKPRQTIFSDRFPGTELSNQWEVINRNPDNYTVEHDNLLIIARSVGGFGSDKSENIFRLNKQIPDSDFVITVTFNVEFQTLRENLFFGLIEDSKNYLAAELYAKSDCCGADLVLRLIKVSGGQATQFDLPVTSTKAAAQPISIRLTKEDHEYRAGVNFAGQVDNAGAPLWSNTGSVTSLHPFKTFALNASQWQETSGESPFRINSVTIDVMAK